MTEKGYDDYPEVIRARRERIATQVLSAMLISTKTFYVDNQAKAVLTATDTARVAMSMADALIAELDK